MKKENGKEIKEFSISFNETRTSLKNVHFKGENLKDVIKQLCGCLNQITIFKRNGENDEDCYYNWDIHGAWVLSEETESNPVTHKYIHHNKLKNLVKIVRQECDCEIN